MEPHIWLNFRTSAPFLLINLVQPHKTNMSDNCATENAIDPKMIYIFLIKLLLLYLLIVKT